MDNLNTQMEVIEKFRDGDAMVQEEGLFLFGLICAIKPSICVETGTHKTLSSHYIAMGLKWNYERFNHKGHLWTTDPYDWGQEANLKYSPFKEWITYQRIKGVDLEVDGKIDFAFIDGFHEKEEVYAEIQHFLPKMAKNGIMVFHDCDDIPECNERMVNAGIKEAGLKTVYLPTKNRMRIYEVSNT